MEKGSINFKFKGKKLNVFHHCRFHRKLLFAVHHQIQVFLQLLNSCSAGYVVGEARNLPLDVTRCCWEIVGIKSYLPDRAAVPAAQEHRGQRGP